MIYEGTHDFWEGSFPGFFQTQVPVPSLSQTDFTVKYNVVKIKIEKGKNPYCRVSLYRKEKGSEGEVKIVDMGTPVYENSSGRAGYYIVDSAAESGKTYIYSATCVIPSNGSSRKEQESGHSDTVEISVPEYTVPVPVLSETDFMFYSSTGYDYNVEIKIENWEDSNLKVSLYRKEWGSEEEVKVVDMGTPVYRESSYHKGYYIIDSSASWKGSVYSATYVIPSTMEESEHSNSVIIRNKD